MFRPIGALGLIRRTANSKHSTHCRSKPVSPRFTTSIRNACQGDCTNFERVARVIKDSRRNKDMSLTAAGARVFGKGDSTWLESFKTKVSNKSGHMNQPLYSHGSCIIRHMSPDNEQAILFPVQNNMVAQHHLTSCRLIIIIGKYFTFCGDNHQYHTAYSLVDPPNRHACRFP